MKKIYYSAAILAVLLVLLIPILKRRNAKPIVIRFGAVNDKNLTSGTVPRIIEREYYGYNGQVDTGKTGTPKFTPAQIKFNSDSLLLTLGDTNGKIEPPPRCLLSGISYSNYQLTMSYATSDCPPMHFQTKEKNIPKILRENLNIRIRCLKQPSPLTNK